MILPYSEASERNKAPIGEVLRSLIPAEPFRVLEIGSGTGQHAVYFGHLFPQVIWQTSDVTENHLVIGARIAESRLANVLPPLDLDVDAAWPSAAYDLVFSANTAHIMSWPQVQAMFRGVAGVLQADGCFVLYGPFNRNGAFTSESNRRFDASLRASVPHGGIRDLADITREAEKNGMNLYKTCPMPANNMCLILNKLG